MTRPVNGMGTGKNPKSHGNTRGKPVRSRNKGGKQPPAGWDERFFLALRQTNLFFEACKAAGISPSFAYGKKKTDPQFAERWENEIERGTEILEQIAVRRAAEGSDTLLIFLLKARRPGVYRENVHHEHQHQVEGSLTMMVDGRQPVQMEPGKRREAARLLMSAHDDDVIEGEATEISDDEEDAA